MPVPQKNKPLWFVLGREPLLSLAELSAVLPCTLEPTERLTPEIYRATSAAFSATELSAKLGGVIKIAEEITDGLTEEKLFEVITATLLTTEGKIHFGLSSYSPELGVATLRDWGLALKSTLKAAGRSVRFVPSTLPALSSATVWHNGLTDRGSEFMILKQSGGWALAKTRAVQPFEAFSERDYGRPGVDAKSGMLPPKLALMMLNLATGAPLPSQRSLTILDPFCGSGTILTEALLQGHTTLIGSDLSPKATADTEQNIAWTEKKYSKSDIHCSVFTSDVRDLPQKLSAKSVAAIITEPYLGPPLRGSESVADVKKNCRELSSLYVDAFKSFQTLLTPGGHVVFIIPRFTLQNRTEIISTTLVPELQKLGFTPEPLVPPTFSKNPFVLYHRPGQFAAREIWKFVKNA